MSPLAPAPQPAPPTRQNWMHPIRWVPPDASRLLDVGCNVGELLSYCRELYPTMRLAGVEVNGVALDVARQRLPDSDLHTVGAETLPFTDASFDCVTCIEVLEHLPAERRAQALAEMRRVLRPGGRLVLRVPHAGLFACLDPNNLRFRMPALYQALLGKGGRDAGDVPQSTEVVWHHHFTRDELLVMAGDGWEIEACRTGGLLLCVLLGAASWPFYRLQWTDNALFRAMSRLQNFDLGWDYGAASYDLLLVLRRA